MLFYLDMRFAIFLCVLLWGYAACSQTHPGLVVKRFKVKDSIKLDSVSINPFLFSLKSLKGKDMDSSLYYVDYGKSILRLKTGLIKTDSVEVSYLPYPEFLTRTYRLYDPAIILNNESRQEQLVKFRQSNIKRRFVPFDGLQTTGSITRGLRVGNNQNSVVDSELDLRITGKLNDRVSLRASIQDANVPQTQNGYSQRLDEFDQIFIELYSDNWNLRAGDVDLIQDDFKFNMFTKRVQGISGNINFKGEQSSGYAGAAAALVRGTFNISRFTGEEGNQGPYKLQGANGELFILVVSGSERVFVNGILLTRGENADYIIDYNAGEVRFTPTFPITSEMRISIEYQYSERNFTRLVGYSKGGYQTRNFNIESYVYTESDSKNQPLQQSLSEEQVSILSRAGDDPALAVAPSATPEEFSENRILYRTRVVNGETVFEFSQDPTVQLFTVRFSFVGAGNGNYNLVDDQAIENIYKYVPPVAGAPQGDYEPIVQLFTPESLTIAGLKSNYNPRPSTVVATELAWSYNDLNRFSSFDDDDNTGVAIKLDGQQEFLRTDSINSLTARISGDYIHENFRNVERVYNIEFSRDWNIDEVTGNQLLSRVGVDYKKDTTITLQYSFEHLELGSAYNGNRHNLAGTYNEHSWRARFRGSILNTNSQSRESDFNRLDVDVLKKLGRNYVGMRFNGESNEQINKESQTLTSLSQRFAGYEVYVGRGDTTSTFMEVGYRNRVNDSLRLNELTRVNTSNNYYINSQLLKSKTSNLRLYANYRILKSNYDTIPDEISLNSRLQFNKRLFSNKVQLLTTYETNSASIPRQDFTYLEVNAGQGTFTWIDYNNDGIQDLNEFETAQFQDQANYVRVLLPNQIFLPTHQNKFSTTLTLNPASWAQKSGIKKVISRFFNQTSYLIDRMVRREGKDFDLNPFNGSDDQLGLNLSFRNSLFFNRGKQYYTTNYTYLSTENQALQSIGFLRSEIESHQISFLHKIADQWLFTFNAQLGFNSSESENFANRNFKIDEELIKPQVSYLFSASNRIDLFYERESKNNQVNTPAALVQHNIGVSWSFNKAQKFTINGEARYIDNDFDGSAFSPVGFQMLEGLQAGSNLTWNLLFQKNLTKFLDLNLNYNGRSSERSRTVHNGSIQLKAYF
ncbi:MAG: hypothetical protein WBA16_05655 [Nonlabens sp.]